MSSLPSRCSATSFGSAGPGKVRRDTIRCVAVACGKRTYDMLTFMFVPVGMVQHGMVNLAWVRLGVRVVRSALVQFGVAHSSEVLVRIIQLDVAHFGLCLYVW